MAFTLLYLHIIHYNLKSIILKYNKYIIIKNHLLE